MTADRLARQIRFIVEIDKLKGVFRRTYLMDRSRHENSAEHSWHLAMMALLLGEYAAERDIDVFRVIKMVLIHDLVEIETGDTFFYDQAGQADRPERERLAAERLFVLLPADQESEFRKLWEEFESRSTSEARFAAALDRLQPLLHNYHTQGAAWREHGVTAEQVISRNRHIAEGAPQLWDYAERFIRDAVEKGYLTKLNT
ncbi:MAG: HD domain-containing protein [Planctomycetes bacterium]|nr:HD domain-containing protein [Planctomycetota bacterium]